ncbi:hypothetical protein BCR34DRAFT_583076 [Clohesyomyces aquaticus]|uniref:Short chain dehydrogenase n=1 Tax=Clohesyomyces aquaticus TaxID=1231657 RepID=A0A1Y2A6J4_9PLEO|nr:hypothetical protein BCR34DRAFT_583076 [Clohesyomyces aquaticus]
MADATKYSRKLADSRILIIGGSSGLGFAVAEACLESGALVTISSSNPSRIDNALSRVKSSYPSASSRLHGIAVDLSSPQTLEAQLEKLFQGTIVKFGGADGKLDHVVFTAADALAMVKIADMTPDGIVKAGHMRFVVPLILAKFVQKYLVPSHTSSYTVTTGSISEKPIPDWSVVASYAGGHHSMVRNLALDLRPVRVNGVSPGGVDTELWKMSEEEKKKAFEEFARKMATGRIGMPEDVAEAFLVCMRDRNMDGAVVRTDGGVMLM